MEAKKVTRTTYAGQFSEDLPLKRPKETGKLYTDIFDEPKPSETKQDFDFISEQQDE